MDDQRPSSATEILETAAAELAAISRPKLYSFWRQEAEPRVHHALAEVEPFSAFQCVWIYTGDGGGIIATPRFGAWAIDMLVEKKEPDAILAAFTAEVDLNTASYHDISPVLGVQIDERCDLGDGAALVPAPEDALASVMRWSPYQPPYLPAGTALFLQPFTVTPAFERAGKDGIPQGKQSTTVPPSSYRYEQRERVRLACLLAGAGPVELPLTVSQPESSTPTLFVGGGGNLMARPAAAHPFVPYPIDRLAILRAFDLLGEFRELDSLVRAIDRLGRARLAASPVDRALDLGIAAEIALMHDHKQNNAEITQKIGSRAAWLLGRTPICQSAA
ncbi:hypothetical protein [Nitrospirillum iridis]|uniref:Uncharacterized protein n=1 Tax=Nitrospirillum iridis TaxID=765888 RepID=A0A7X0EGU3_9PROT|nr:hypothetical protein [Nitrospirillum iridis]MBB6255300.1 hypothetical protein [Nitrospirillum iridis]